MLQQTQVATVVPYFERFIARFPTLESLRLATESDVLSAWEGLGYYRRAKNLLAAAKTIREVPDSVDDLLNLPGIGEYSAAAIASIAFNGKHAAVDGNVERVISRLECAAETDQPLKRRCKMTSEAMMGDASPGEWNQALMELGAVICRPAEPRCDSCPVAAHCCARASGKQSDYPVVRSEAKVTRLHHVCVCPTHVGKFGLRQIQEGSWWTGMWEFPRTQVESHLGTLKTITLLGYPNARHLVRVRHRVTRYSVTLDAFLADVETPDKSLRWETAAGMSDLPMPAPQRKVAEQAVGAVSSAPR